MRAIIQRVNKAKVKVNDKLIGKIGNGLVIFLGIGKDDSQNEADYLVDKILNLRIFADDNDKMNLSALDENKDILVVSQFTLYGDCSEGRRPSFSAAAPPNRAEDLYEYFVEQIQNRDIQVATGEFKAMMNVELINDGPVTFHLDTDQLQE